MENKLIVFTEHRRDKTNSFSGDELVFALPYVLILEAEDYCRRENVSHCYVGFDNHTWTRDVTKDHFLFYIKVNSNGIASDTTDKFLYHIEE